MRSIQATAIILWIVIFVIISFVLGQFLSSKGILDVTSFITGDSNEKDTKDETISKQDNELESDIAINKIGQETVRIGKNVATDYFKTCYKEYVNYVLTSTEYKEKEKTAITSELASDYVFYAVSNGLDNAKYVSENKEDVVVIAEGEINSFADKMFAQSISDKYKNENGYDKVKKEYTVQKKEDILSYSQELISVENITSNEVKLTFSCKELSEKDDKTEVKTQKQITIYAVYRGGRYIVTNVEKD